MLSINDVLVIGSEEHRVLWVDTATDLVYTIELAATGVPVAASLKKILDQIQSGDYLVKPGDQQKPILESELSDYDKSCRDSAWKVIEPLVLNEPAIYERTARGALISPIIAQTGSTKATIYKYLRRYWQRGKVKNTLLPDIRNCGGKGVPRKLGNSKLGRPRKHGSAVGKNTDDETKLIFEKAVSRFYHNRTELPFTAVYDLMLKEYYTDKVVLSDGNVRLQLKPQDELPSIRQFRYWYSKAYDEAAKITARKGESAFLRNHRAVLGKSDTNIVGPGSQYQIDATVGDIYLVSQFNRANIIGRPVIYFVIDTFSRMVAGMYVGLEGPSWAGAMMALCNAASDKVAYCHAYGIEITEGQWPCRYIPDTILADRGEMESNNVETLINALNVRVDNAPPYRADMKGIVEQYFRTINTKTTIFLPGHVKPDIMQRGGHDYRLDAKLDINQFTKIIIQCALNHNNEHFLDGYERQEDMIADDIAPVPINLWNWGIAHRSGRLRSVSENLLKLCLMPTGTALVTAKGIRFKGLIYLCERAVQEHWFETARAKGSFHVDISYDPRNMNTIYLRESENAEVESCFLADWESKFRDKCLDEIQWLQESEKVMKSSHGPQEAQARVDLNAEIEKVLREAEAMAQQTAIPAVKGERTGNIRVNRASEKQVIRQYEAFILDGEAAPTSIAPSSAPQVPTEAEDLSPTLAMIKRKLEERLNEA